MDLSQSGQLGVEGVGRIGRKHPIAARILRRWRALTGGSGVADEHRRTVVACSGGADSVALALVLASVNPKPMIAHITHDIRAEDEVERDRVFVERLSEHLGCTFAHESVRVIDRDGNLEENARDARYTALLRIAQADGCPFIATAHHADDQAETVLMNLVRGSGVRGLGGIPDERSLGSVRVVRPALGVRRGELESLCEEAGAGYRHDPTNDDVEMLRNRVRADLLPMLESIRADAIERIGDAATNCVDAQRVIARAVDDEWARWTRAGDGIERDRGAGRSLLGAVFDGILRRFVIEHADGRGLDSLSSRSVRAAYEGVVSDSTEARNYRVGVVVVDVTAHRIRLEMATERSDG
jgi:tRNA(Ile)-lysidine synthase